MQRVSLAVVALTVLSLILLAPTLARAELSTNTDFELGVPQDQELNLRFSTFDLEATPNTEDDDYYSPSILDGQIGYWFEDVPWLGLASEAPLVQMEREDLDTSIDAGTDFDPLSSFLLFRYQDQNGQLQPYIGIGPTLFLSDLANEKVDVLRHILMGVSYRF